MKVKVRLTHSVEMLVEAASNEQLLDWLNTTTPIEAADQANTFVEQNYSEEIICHVSDDSVGDLSLME